MPGHRGWSHERRENLAELDPVLRDRLLGLDEPVDRSDWAAVVERSRLPRPSRYRSFALVATGAVVASLALASLLVQQLPSGGRSARAAAPLRLTVHLSDGSGLVLYSEAGRAAFLDNSDDRLGGGEPSARAKSEASGTAAIVRSLSGGPFHVSPALIRAENAAQQVSGPLPGDEALVSLEVFTTPELQKAVGSALLTCRYAFDRNAYCDGAVELADGVRLTAAGTLDADADHLTLAITSGYGRDGIGRGALTASRPDQV
jgi:hypothetical protein